MFTNIYSFRRLLIFCAITMIVALSFPCSGTAAKKPSGWTDLFTNANYGGPDNYAMKLVEFDGMVVVGGEFTEIGGELSSIAEANNIAAFDGNGWVELDGGLTGGDLSRVFALAVYNGDLIVGGNFNQAGSVSVRNIARWDGTNWYSLGSGLGNIDGRVYSLFVWNG